MRANIIEQIIQLFEDTQPNKPLQGYLIRITRKDANEKEIPLADVYPNMEGIVKVKIPVEKSESGSIPEKIVIHLYVLGIDDKELLKKEVEVVVDKPEPVSFTVATANYLSALKVPIDSLDVSLSSSVESVLKRHKIENLADIRDLMDMKKLGDPSTVDDKQVEMLMAHAQLQVLSRDTKVNQALIEKGYRSLLDIVSSPYAEFLKHVKKDLGEDRAKTLYQVARRQKQILINIDTELRVDEANGYQGQLQLSTASEAVPGHVNCCKECDSAVSPAVYLADLMDYAIDHTRYNDQTLTTGALQTRFRQHFLDLINDCSALSAPVRQIRLVIEVLRVLALRPGVDIGDLIEKHTSSAYRALLNALGLTRQSLREARHHDSEKQRIEELIGIPNSKVVKLLLNPQTRTENKFEQLFGLQDTGRDPLSTGAKFNDEKDQIKRWQLIGINWNKNTDENGHINGSLRKAGNTYVCELFKPDNNASGILIAKGETQSKNGTINLLPKNDSGLTGKVNIDWQENDTFSIVAVPELLAWQLQFLRELWRREDYNTEAAALQTSIIDPDLLVNEDFIRPYDKNSAYTLFLHRKAWINDLEGQLTGMSLLNNVFKRFKQEVKYTRKSNANQEHKEILWSNFDATDFGKWDTTLRDLQSSNESIAAGAVQKLHDDIHLEMPQFQYLASIQKELRLLTGEEKTNYEAEVKISVIQILLQAIKKRFYNDWKEEEKDVNISLSAPFFWLNTVEPVLPYHQIDAALRTQWMEQLRRNSNAPILDPDRLTTSWFVGGNSADSAYNLYDERLTLLKGLNDKLKTDLKSSSALEKVLTGTDFGSDGLTIHALGFTQTDLDALLDLHKEQKPIDIQPGQYGLTATTLTTLLNVRDLVKSNNADNEDWEQAYHILIQAEKNRHLFPAWFEQEQEKEITVSPDIFKFPDELADRIDLQPGASQAFRERRIDTTAARSFRSRLEDRIDRQNTVIAAHANLIDQVEDATLSTLRDELLNSVDAAQGDDKKTWFSNHYLINASVSACQKTTRVAQAIETLQLLIWGLYTKQFEDSSFKLTPSDAFDEEWKWMGSYASWRSAMFVFLYPENILYPHLRPEEEQSLVFKAFVKVLIKGYQPNSTIDRNDSETNSSTDEVEKIKIIASNIVDQFDYKNANQHYYQDLYSSLSGATNDNLSGRETEVINEILAWKDNEILERYYYVPMLIAFHLQKRGEFYNALKWFGTVYDYDLFSLHHRVNSIFQSQSNLNNFSRENWLLDPLNPHKISYTRTDTDLRFILISIIGCFLDYAESEFYTDTAESLAHARELYMSAQRLLNTEALKQRYDDCEDMIGELTIQIGDDVIREILIDSLLHIIEQDVDGLQLPGNWDNLRQDIEAKLSEWQNESRDQIREDVNKLISKSFPVQPAYSLNEGREQNKKLRYTQFAELLQNPQVFNTVQRIDEVGSIRPHRVAPGSVGFGNVAGPLFDPPGLTILGIGPNTRIPAPQANFCIPPNPILIGLRLRVISGLFKLNNCMNIAGIIREVPAFSAPTDTTTGIPVLNSAGSLVLPFASPMPPPTQYRYKVLVERARQLVSIAQQMESSFLNFMERRDQETFSLLTAKQQLEVAKAGVALQDLRIDEAELQRGIADLQVDRIEFVRGHYVDLINKGLLLQEITALLLLSLAATAQGISTLISSLVGAGVFGSVTGGAAAKWGIFAGAVATGGAGLSTTSSALSLSASQDRRKQEWEFQRDLSMHDLDIAKAQVNLAEQHFDIVKQEGTIARINADNADTVITFLQNKFTSAELYEWMSGIVSDIYRYFLQQATAMARLAQS